MREDGERDTTADEDGGFEREWGLWMFVIVVKD